MSLLAFLALTFGISLAGFGAIVALPAARSPDSLAGLPFWLLMVWGPSLAAILLALREGTLSALLGRVVQVSSVPPEAVLLIAAPLVLLLILRPFASDETTTLSLGMVVTMTGFNLILGPLGEELGWRGVMQDQLTPSFGWLGASLLTGLVWLFWHLPLWTIDSPHAQIPLHLFAGHCLCYAVIIGGAHAMSGGSLLPAILIHLAVNLAANFALFAGFRDPGAWFAAALLPYLGLAMLTIVLVALKSGQQFPQ